MPNLWPEPRAPTHTPRAASAAPPTKAARGPAAGVPCGGMGGGAKGHVTARGDHSTGGQRKRRVPVYQCWKVSPTRGGRLAPPKNLMILVWFRSRGFISSLLLENGIATK